MLPSNLSTTSRTVLNVLNQHTNETLVVSFTKKNGEHRRLVGVLYSEYLLSHLEKGMVMMWDIEKGGRRLVTLCNVHEIKAHGEPIYKTQTFAEVQAEMDALFG